MAPVTGVGYLIANDILTDCSFALFQSAVKTAVPTGGIQAGTQTVNVYDPSMYVGAQLVIGQVGGAIEVVTISAVVVGVSFTATFANAHNSGESITGATFPVRQPTDPLFTQAEMISYLSTAVNDFLTDCPIVFAVNDSLQVQPTQQNTALPGDCMFPVRVAVITASNPSIAAYPLRETSQAIMDSLNYQWNQQAAAQPYTYFRDKVPFESVGVWPRANTATNLEVIYAQRQTNGSMGLADGFLIPDPFLIYPLYKTLVYAFSKDGECRNPALAKFFQARYEWGTKICQMFLESVMDPNLETAQ